MKKSAGFSRRIIPFLITAAAILLLSSCSEDLVQQPVTYSVIPGKADAQVTCQVHNDNVIVEVRSQSGIGNAQLFQVGGGVPVSLVTRLHLRGLEQLNFEYPGISIAVSVSTHDRSVIESVSVKGSSGQPIGPDSPYWVPVTIVATETTIPLKDGYFEAHAPKHFLDAEIREFTLRWVDFYR